MQEKLETYRKLCEQITHQTISTNDIFPRLGFNIAFIPLIFNVKKFGIDVLNKYLAYLTHCNQVRKNISELSKKLNRCSPDKIALIKYLSMLKMGIGESDVLSHGVCYHLLKNHPSLECAVISLENQEHKKHHLILISQILPEKNVFFSNALLALPSDAIIIDPYLHFVRPASEYLSENKFFLEMHQYDKISGIQSKSPLSPLDQHIMERQVQQLCEKLTNNTQESHDPIAVLRESFFHDAPPKISEMIIQKQERHSI